MSDTKLKLWQRVVLWPPLRFILPTATTLAGAVAAIIEGGGDATLAGQVLLGIAAWYAIWSLFVPIYLVGPQSRETIDLNHLIVAAEDDNPEQYLAVQAQEAAQGNVRRAHRIGNLQDAARNELSAALAVLTAWLVLGPSVGLLQRDESPRNRERRPADRTTDHNADDAITDDNAHVYHAFASDDYEAAGTAHDSERRTLTAASRNARPVASP